MGKRKATHFSTEALVPTCLSIPEDLHKHPERGRQTGSSSEKIGTSTSLQRFVEIVESRQGSSSEVVGNTWLRESQREALGNTLERSPARSPQHSSFHSIRAIQQAGSRAQGTGGQAAISPPRHRVKAVRARKSRLKLDSTLSKLDWKNEAG
ncbi:hypothetical protein AOLI_G00027220 [Acnodon oligacanthus]